MLRCVALVQAAVPPSSVTGFLRDSCGFLRDSFMIDDTMAVSLRINCMIGVLVTNAAFVHYNDSTDCIIYECSTGVLLIPVLHSCHHKSTADLRTMLPLKG